MIHERISQFIWLFLMGFFVLMIMATSVAFAIALPSEEDFRNKLKLVPESVLVVEPHLTQNNQMTYVEYVGYPVAEVFNLLLGAEWNQMDADVEFRALDGYVSRIEISEFRRHRAYLAYARKDKAEFVVDNIGQNEKRVPLGPYYLIWDNIGSSRLLESGASNWPYQVYEISISELRKQALFPENLSPAYLEHARLTQKHCLTCHQINGYGGDKWKINLIAYIKTVDEEAFMNRVLNPASKKPDTTMPPLMRARPQADRELAARRIYQYLRALSSVAD